MGTDGACSLLFFAAKRSVAFPPDMPAGLRARCRVSAVLRGRSPGNYFPPAGNRLFVITGVAAISRSRSSSILVVWWSEHCNDFIKVLIAQNKPACSRSHLPFFVPPFNIPPDRRGAGFSKSIRPPLG
jgi:hypothetical protein